MENGCSRYQYLLESVYNAPPAPSVFLSHFVLVLGFTLCNKTPFNENLLEPVSHSITFFSHQYCRATGMAGVDKWVSGVSWDALQVFPITVPIYFPFCVL